MDRGMVGWLAELMDGWMDGHNWNATCLTYLSNPIFKTVFFFLSSCLAIVTNRNVSECLDGA